MPHGCAAASAPRAPMRRNLMPRMDGTRQAQLVRAAMMLAR
jgi:hypothetical protein